MQQVLPSSLFSSKELMSSLSTPPCLQMPAQPVQAPRCSVSLPHLCSPNHTFLAGSHLPEQGCLDSAKLNYLDEYFIAFFFDKCRFRAIKTCPEFRSNQAVSSGGKEKSGKVSFRHQKRK